MSLLDHPIIGERYFFPRRDTFEDPFMVQVDGASLACHRARPHPGAPTLVHFHGNGEVVGDYVHDFVPALHALGLNTFFAEYRGYGGSTGTPRLASMLGDVDALIDAAGAPPEELVVYGRSVGSLFAVHAIHRFPSIPQLVLESGIVDAHERLRLRMHPSELGCTEDELKEAVDAALPQERRLAAYEGRVLVLHTDHDHMVDVGHAVRLAEAAPHSELVRYPRGDHNSILAYNGADILERVARASL